MYLRPGSGPRQAPGRPCAQRGSGVVSGMIGRTWLLLLMHLPMEVPRSAKICTTCAAPAQVIDAQFVIALADHKPNDQGVGLHLTSPHGKHALPWPRLRHSACQALGLRAAVRAVGAGPVLGGRSSEA